MRAILVKAIWLVAFAAGLAAAVSWAYFIWGFDWGVSYRGRALWMWALFLPAMLGFLAAFFVVSIVSNIIWEAVFHEELPPPV